MGNKWEVHAYYFDKQLDMYMYGLIWRGDSDTRAQQEFAFATYDFSAVKLEWRG
jgi:hypothetical protein